MAITIDLQGNPDAEGNPYIADVGKQDSDAVIIYPGSSRGSIVYQIARKDKIAFDGLSGHTVLSIPNNFGTSELIKEVSNTCLKIILPFRTEFKVRVSIDGGNNFGNGVPNDSTTSVGNYTNGKWINFKTRDKSYALPDSNTELRVEEIATANGSTINVSNYGKSSIVYTSRGATVTNRSKQSNDVIVSEVHHDGYYIKTKTNIKATATGAEVNKIS